MHKECYSKNYTRLSPYTIRRSPSGGIILILSQNTDCQAFLELMESFTLYHGWVRRGNNQAPS
jgi:hypothetical protein